MGWKERIFEFRLSQAYPARELITQWRETDLTFVQRLLAEVGIFWRFEMDGRIEQDVVIFPGQSDAVSVWREAACYPAVTHE